MSNALEVNCIHMVDGAIVKYNLGVNPSIQELVNAMVLYQR